MNFHYSTNFTKWLLILVVIIIVIILALVLSLTSKNDRHLTSFGGHGAVVSNGRGCAEIGSQMLEDGGSAVDSAIATLLCEGIILPHSMGLGGGFVAVIYTKSNRKIETLTARESAPAAAREDMFIGATSITGAIAGAVPGELLGYWELHKRYGRLPWKVLFQPTIELCKNGHWVSKYLAAALASKEKEIRASPSMAEIFIKPDGTLYKEGDYMKRTVFGQTLEQIAEHGADIMYNGGKIGQMFTEDIQKMGGIITEKDLKDYRVTWEDSPHVRANCSNDYTLYTTPLPSSGALLAFILNVLSGLYTDNRNVYWQRATETFKHAFGQRSNLGDLRNEEAMAATINETFNNLISREFSEKVRSLIHDDKTYTNYSYYGANFTVENDHGTANMAVLAPNGDAIVVTSTVNNYFGAKVRSPRTGIILNDEMDDFATPGLVNGFGIPASPANYIKPGKRPMSSMCPAILLDKQGNVRMLVGAAGGTKITTTIAIAIIKYLIFNESIEHAVNDGRLHHQLAPMQVDYEAEVPLNTREYLEKIGHKLELLPVGTGFAALTAIGVRDNKPIPIYDRRRVGSVSLVQVKNKMNH